MSSVQERQDRRGQKMHRVVKHRRSKERKLWNKHFIEKAMFC
jgi:hypothetical protein